MNNNLVDSGERTTFETGAMRELTEDKGRCDLVPIDVLVYYDDYLVNLESPIGVPSYNNILMDILDFRLNHDVRSIYHAIAIFQSILHWNNYTLWTELSFHYRDGALKYSDRNWEKGLPLHTFVDSGIRHLLKFRTGMNDEHHDRAFLWNMVGLVWTFIHHPELDDYTVVEDKT